MDAVLIDVCHFFKGATAEGIDMLLGEGFHSNGFLKGQTVKIDGYTPELLNSKDWTAKH
jgi:hypothetical protein